MILMKSRFLIKHGSREDFIQKLNKPYLIFVSSGRPVCNHESCQGHGGRETQKVRMNFDLIHVYYKTCL